MTSTEARSVKMKEFLDQGKSREVLWSEKLMAIAESINMVSNLLALRRVTTNDKSTAIVVTTSQTQTISVASCPTASRKSEAGAEAEDEERARVIESLKQSLVAAASARGLPSVTVCSISP